MSNNVFRLTLPAPSDSIIKAAKEFVDGLDIDPSGADWLEQQIPGINVAIHNFEERPWLGEMLKPEFQDFFPLHRVGGTIGVMQNRRSPVPACMPPHNDRSRAVALNYFVELGGDDVKTVFYNKEEKIEGRAMLYRYNEVSPLETYHTAPGWICYNVARAHSVENIMSRRFFLAIRLVRNEIDDFRDPEYTIYDFIRDYPHLVNRD